MSASICWLSLLVRILKPNWHSTFTLVCHLLLLSINTISRNDIFCPNYCTSPSIFECPPSLNRPKLIWVRALAWEAASLTTWTMITVVVAVTSHAYTTATNTLLQVIHVLLYTWCQGCQGWMDLGYMLVLINLVYHLLMTKRLNVLVLDIQVSALLSKAYQRKYEQI